MNSSTNILIKIQNVPNSKLIATQDHNWASRKITTIKHLQKT